MAASRMLQGRDLRCVGALALLLVLWTAVSSTATAAVPSDRATALERRLGTPADAVVHRDTGRVRFLATPPRRPLARPRGVPAGAAPARVARAFLDSYGSSFGVPDEARQLDVTATADGPRGGSVVRFEQVQDGVPVLGGELVVNLDGDGRVRSAGGEAIPAGELASLDMRPSVASVDAVRTARAVVARAHGVAAADLHAAPAELQVYDARLLGGPGPQRPTLVWRTEVTGGVAGEIRELVLVDAQLGSVALHFNQAADAKQRTVCDWGGAVRGSLQSCTAPVRSEGEPPVGSPADVDLAYDYAGDTYDFFFGRFGRDSLDDRGLPLRSTVRFCDPDEDCPYRNAFWNGQQMVYGDGFAAADDVVGHELTHGVTEFSSHLFYYYQSGAINESLSDIFGELIDLTNGAGNDTAGVRWLMGEDIPGIGAIRDMANPPRFGDPDRMTSPSYFADPNEGDNGGVHWNSGVGNKAAYLMTDGDTFNGETVTGLGIDKVAQIFYTASTTLLTSASDYADLAIALRQACANLVGSHGIVAADCNQVDATIRAVEMEADPPAAPAPEAPVCNAGGALVDVYEDDFENPASGRWAAATGWYRSQESNPYGFDATFATSGTGNLWGDDQDSIGDYSIAMTSDVVVPAGGYLRFKHAFGFDDDVSGAYDGGVLEYSLNGGGTWNDAGPLMANNGYTGIVVSYPESLSHLESPLAGRRAFVRESNGYRSTRVDLRSFGGQSIRLRFRIGTDYVFGDYGWFVDDVRFYGCDAIPPETTIDDGPSGVIGDDSPTFDVASNEPGSTFQCRLDDGAFRACPSSVTYASLVDRPYVFEVRAVDAEGNVDPTPALTTFTVETGPPETSIDSGPSGVISSDSATFTFSADQVGSTFECRLDGGSFVSCSSPKLYVSLSDDQHTFEVRARDPLDNVDQTPASRSFTVDTTPPPSDPPPAIDHEPDEPAARARATVVRKRVVVRRGRVRLVLRCRADGVERCRGKVLLGRRGSLGRRGFAIAAGRRGAVVVKLSRRARRALARRGAIRLAVTVRTRVPGASTATARARVTAILRA